jgi:hypothetical protein
LTATGIQFSLNFLIGAISKFINTFFYLFSKKIQSLGIDDEKNPTSGTALSLQLKIRLSAVNFLKENLLGLPNLPTEEQLIVLQAERR